MDRSSILAACTLARIEHANALFAFEEILRLMACGDDSELFHDAKAVAQKRVLAAQQALNLLAAELMACA